jgi:ABC-type uncharacterized transport system YnjBCD permease subunit
MLYVCLPVHCAIALYFTVLNRQHAHHAQRAMHVLLLALQLLVHQVSYTAYNVSSLPQ